MAEPTKLKPFDGKLDAADAAAPSTSALKPFNGSLDGEGGFVSDVGKSIKVGVQELPGIATGLADLPFALAAGARPFTKAFDALGEATGFQPGKWAKEAKFSQGYEQGKANIDKAWEDGSAGDIALEYLKNPGYTANQVAQSIPGMVLGGVGSKVALGAGRVAGVAADAAAGVAAKKALPGALERVVGEKWAVPLAAGAGEGAITAGQQMAQYEGADQQTNALASLAAGAGTAAIGVGAGRLANKLGLETAETAIAKLGSKAAGAADEVPLSTQRRILGGIVSEAVLQEMPQSAQEQMWQNYADGKPIMQGVTRATVEGGLAGAVMGGAANVRGPSAERALAPEQEQGAAPAQPPLMGLAAQPADIGTSPGAADPNAPQREAATAPQALDATTAPGAAPESGNGVDFTREIDTSGLGLQDPAEAERARAATVDYAPTDTTPQWGTEQGAAAERQGMDMPSQEFDTSSLSLDQRPLSQQMGIDPKAGPLSSAAAMAVDSGAHGQAQQDQALQAAADAAQKQRPAKNQEQTNVGANNQPAAGLLPLGGAVGDDAGRGAAAPSAVRVDAQRPGGRVPGALAGAPAEPGAARPAGRADGDAPLAQPGSLKEGLAAIREKKARESAATAEAPGLESGQVAPGSSGISQPSGQSSQQIPALLDAGSEQSLESEGAPSSRAPPSLADSDSSAPGASQGSRSPSANDATGRAISQPQGATSEPQANQAQQAEPQPAQAGNPAPVGAAAPTIAGAVSVGGRGGQAAGLNNGAPTQNTGTQAAPAPGTQGAPTAERHPNWRKNAIQAGRVSRELGLEPKGKRLAQIVAEVDAVDRGPVPEQNQPAPSDKPVEPVRLGRNQTPLREGGKPFATKAAATDAKKQHPMMRVVKVKGGFALADKTPAQLAAEAKAAKRLSRANTSAAGEPIPAHAFIAGAGGLSQDMRADLGVDGNPRIGNRTLFAGRGLSIEQATANLIEDGYLSQGASHNDAYALIKRSLTQPQYNADGIERIAEAESAAQFEDHLAAQAEAADDANFDPFASGEAAGYIEDDFDDSGYVRASDAIRSEVRALQTQAEALGIDAETLLEDAERATRNQSEQEYYEYAKQVLNEAISSAVAQSAGSRSNGATGQDGQGGGQEAQPRSAANDRQDDGREGAPRADGEAGRVRKADDASLVVAQQIKDADRVYATKKRLAAAYRKEAYKGVRENYDTLRADLQSVADGKGADSAMAAGVLSDFDESIANQKLRQNTRPIDGEGFGLEAPSRAEVVARQDEQEAASKQKAKDDAKAEADAKKERDRKDVASRMDASAENYVLGQSAEDALSGQGDVFGGQQPAKQDGPQIPSTGKILAQETVKLEPTKRQDATQFSNYTTGEYIVTVEDFGDDRRGVQLYSVRRSQGVTSIERAPTEMLENGAFDKINQKATALFDAIAAELAQGSVFGERKETPKSNTITITSADVAAAEQQAIAVIEKRIDAMRAGDLNSFAKKFLPTMGMKAVASKERNKAMLTDASKVNLLGVAGELGVELAPSVRKALEMQMEGRVESDSIQAPGKTIADVGEKIGGARKDTAVSTGNKRSKTKETDKGVVMFSRAPGYNAAVDAAVAAGIKGEKPGREEVAIGSTTDAMQAAGIPDGELRTSPAILSKALFDHGVTKSLLKNIPDLLETPVMVFDSDSVNGSYVVVTSEIVGGRPLIVVVSPRQTSGAVAFNFVPSLYPKDDVAAVQRWLSKGRLRYLDQKQSPSWFGSTRLQLPGEYRTAKGLQANNIATEADAVNRRPAAFVGQAAPTRADSNAQNVATQMLVDGLKEHWTKAPPIIVARNMQDAQIPQEVRDYDAELKSQGSDGEARAFIYEGKVYLLSDELKSPEDIATALFHEVLGHFGLRGAFGEALNPILQQMGTMRRKEVVAKAREYGLFDKKALGGADKNAVSDAQIWALMSTKQRLDAAEEVLAELAQTQPDIGFVKRAIALIRNWLRKNVPGFNKLALSDADIVQAYILPAREFVTRSNETPQQSIDRAMMAFSRAPQSRRAAIKEMLDAQAAWDKMKKGDAENITLEKFSEMTDRSMNARTALADELVSMPDDGFALQAKTSDGRMLILTPSAQKAGKWQLTRFGSDGSPWGDTNFDTKKQAALEFIDAADLKTIQGADNVGAAFSRTAADQTQTEAFKRWFEGSKVVDAEGMPLRMYHGSSKDVDFSKFKVGARGAWFTGDPEIASEYAEENDSQGWPYNPDTRKHEATNTASRVLPVYLNIRNPYRLTQEDSQRVNVGNYAKAQRELFAEIKAKGYDGILWNGNLAKEWVVLGDSGQIKSATGNSGAFDGANPDIRFSRTNTATGTQSAWEAPLPSSFDDVVYKMQDKHIDTKRVVDAITAKVGQIKDAVNVYLQEELFHGRAAKRVADFGAMELKPVLNQMRMMGVSLEDMEEFLHARHAKEANDLIAQREPSMPDGGSGMTNKAAADYLKALPVAQRRKLDTAAAKIDAIIAKTRQMYADYGLENQQTVVGWGDMFQSYVPLMREGKDGGMGIGQGFTVKGKEVKGRTGSTRKVVDILANIAAQREKVIVRGEKNRVATALVGLAAANPNKDFWEARSQPPTERVYDAKSDSVVDRPDSMFKQRPNVVTAKVKDANGNVTEQAVVFNEDDPRAMRMAAALKNLDAGQLEGLLGVSAKITRYFSAVNTQYNPVFGVVNLVRDVQGAMVNLGSTELAGQQAKIAKNTLPALAGIYKDVRAARQGKQPTSKWSALWDQMQEDGGTTGYRDLFSTTADRANSLKNIIDPNAWADGKWGKVFTANGKLKVPLSIAKQKAGVLFDWLSDYNEAMENGVRLAAYSAALDKGMTRAQAASLSKNLTVNFNRKGQVGQQAGALYAFFNAAMQGTARIGQALFEMDGGDYKTIRLSSTGKKVIAGGLALGSIQAMMLAAAGFGDDEPPDFVRERSLVIPTGGKGYISIPMPLGLHVIPGLGRHATEFALNGFKDPAKRAISIFGMLADAFNPIGNAGLSMQTLAPTALDPLVALTENKDWTGKPIARTSSNKAVPGHSQWKDTASSPAKWISEAINTMSGGDKYVAGALSPTPDQIDYLFAQVTGGVGRELAKVEQTAGSLTKGEELPTYKVPLVGRFYGNAGSQASEGTAFYASVNNLNEIETKAKAMRKDGKFNEAAEYLRSQPDAPLILRANAAERQIQKLKRDKRDLIEKGADREQVRAKEEQITAVMAGMNRAVEARRALAKQ